MFRTLRFSRSAVLATTLAGAFVCVSQAPAVAWSASADSSDPSAAVMKKLDKKQFKNVHATVDANGIVTLSGTVELAEYKMEADHRAHSVKGIKGVRNDIEVSGPSVSDQELQQKLTQKLAYDRVGYGNMFNAITVNVQNGVVTLGGHARTYPDRDSAVALVSTYPGVKDVEDDIEVDPPSPMDDQTRLAVYRAVYGFPSLNRYAIDPAKPIRISVQNGHVELAGVVDSEADKDAAGIQAKTVPGVFSVQNDIQVANQTKESPQK